MRYITSDIINEAAGGRTDRVGNHARPMRPGVLDDSFIDEDNQRATEAANAAYSARRASYGAHAATEDTEKPRGRHGKHANDRGFSAAHATRSTDATDSYSNGAARREKRRAGKHASTTEAYAKTDSVAQTPENMAEILESKRPVNERGRKGRFGGGTTPPSGNSAGGSSGKSRYIPSLDGLRALAVLAVIAYHMNMQWAQGGLLGVTIFFVLSGYLITSLLIGEWHTTGTISLPRFWLRRVRRLVPAIVLVVLSTALLCALFDHELLTKMRPDIVPSLLFFNNWWQIFHNVSYFEALGSPSPLTHFWSLAIEEQFYLIWPPLLLIAYKLGAKHKLIRRVVIVLALASAVAMALIYNPEADPSRVYYGTDTRAFSLLLGAWLAFTWPAEQLGSPDAAGIGKKNSALLDIIGGVALIGLLAMLAFSNGFSAFPYRGGILLASVLTAVLIAVLVHPASIIARVAGCKPLVWIGKRSFGMYLWHYPIILLLTPQNTTAATPWWLLLIQLALIVIVSALSYTFVENPIRHGAIGRALEPVFARQMSFADLLRQRLVPIAASIILIAGACIGIAVVPETTNESADALIAAQEQAAKEDAVTAADAQRTEPYNALVIGDSVSVRMTPYLEAALPDCHVDAKVSRQLSQGDDVYQWYVNEGLVGPNTILIFSLGTNGPVTTEQVDNLIATVGEDKEIYLVNTRHTKQWQDSTNAALADAASRHDNVTLINWYGTSEGRDDIFDGDGIHVNDAGAQLYAAMVKNAIEARVIAGDAAGDASRVGYLCVVSMLTQVTPDPEITAEADAASGEASDDQASAE